MAMTGVYLFIGPRLRPPSPGDRQYSSASIQPPVRSRTRRSETARAMISEEDEVEEDQSRREDERASMDQQRKTHGGR